MLDLTDTRLKLRRADQHREFLAAEIDRFVKGKPYRVTHKLKKKGRVVFYGWIDARPDPDWGLVAGEFAHQARSALDVMLWEAAPKRIMRKGRLDFPLFTTEKAKDRQGIQPMMDFLPSKAFAVVEGAQPYQRRDIPPKLDLLALLTNLNNTDKHRVLPMIVSPAGLSVRVAGQGSLDSLTAVPINTGRVTQHGAPIAEVILGSAPKGSTVRVQPFLTMQVQFGDGAAAAGLPVAELCRDILARVTQIVDDFEACYA